MTQEKSVEYSIDWIKATVPFEKTVPLILKELGGEDSSIWEDCRASRPYSDAKRCQFATVMWHEQYTEFKILVEMTGKDLSYIRENTDLKGYDMIKWLSGLGANFTRIDFAFDMRGFDGRPKDLYARWASGVLLTSAKKVRFIQERDGSGITGETVYFGGRSSEKFLRVYDKAKERGGKGKWLRAEVECKGTFANTFASTCIREMNTHNGGMTALKNIIPHSGTNWFDEAVKMAEWKLTPLANTGRKATDFEKWLWKIVAPAVEKGLKTGAPGFREFLIKALIEAGKHGP